MPPHGPIEGVPTSTAGFLGYTQSGPVNQATLVTSRAEFDRVFGGLAEDSPVSYAVSDFFVNGGVKAWVVRIVGDTTTPDQPSPSDFQGDRSSGTGVWALEQATDVELLCAPGQADPGLLDDLARYCEHRRAFFIADLPPDIDTAAAAWSWAAARRSRTLRNYAAAYFPWLLMPDPLQHDNPVRRSPTGAVTGLLARLDIARGVWAVPAGPQAILSGVVDVDPALTDAETAALSSVGVNPIRKVPTQGTVIWGARTLRGRDSGDGDGKYVPVRRLMIYLQSSIEKGIQWARFEPNDEPTWSELRQAVEAFMHTLFLQGAFKGRNPCDAYVVRCDQETTAVDDLARGIANIRIAFAPVRPAEFTTLTVPVRCGWLGP